MFDFQSCTGRIYEYDKIGEGDPPSIYEIAAHLSKEQRFAGATRAFYSVAQHAVLVSRLVEIQFGPFEAFYALHHDDHEFMTKDIPTPLKDFLFAVSGNDHVGDLQAKLDEWIYTETLELDYPIPDHIQDAIDEADNIMYVTEGLALVRNFKPPEGIPSASFTVTPMGSEQAEQLFLHRHAQLKTRRGRRVA